MTQSDNAGSQYRRNFESDQGVSNDYQQYSDDLNHCILLGTPTGQMF